MRKVLRFLLILIVILLVGYLILCAVSPSVVEIERSTTINAPKDVVWNQVSNLKYNDNWSPWKKMDSTLVSVITGPEAQVGQKSEWDTKKLGSGNMTITEISDYTMKYDLVFIKPWPGTAKCWVKVEGEDGNVKATQYYKAESGFIMRGVNKLFGKPFLESQFDIGLKLLKDYCESGKAEIPAMSMNFNVEEATFPATSFATIRKTIKITEMDSFFSQSYTALGQAAGSSIKGNAHAIAYKWDETNGQADMAAAFPVSGPVAGMTMVNVPESKGYVIKLTGPYSRIYAAHEVIGKHAAENGITDPMVIEEYVAMPPQVTDSNKFVTHIYYLKK